MAGDKQSTTSSMKIVLNLAISVCVAVAVLLLGIFVIDKLDLSEATHNSKYWTEKILRSVATFAIMLSTANICEESRKQRDGDYKDRMTALGVQYNTLMENGETDQLDIFLVQLNRVNKYNAYLNKYKKRLENIARFCLIKKLRKRLIAKCEEKLIVTPDEVWNGARFIRYHKVTYGQLVSGEFDIDKNTDDYDLSAHKTAYAIKKLFFKAVMLVAFGWVAVDIGYSFKAFNKTMILPLIVKVILILMSAYSGVSFGFSIMERRKVVLKNKLRIFSQFRKRIDDKQVSEEKRFVIEIPKDAIVEKILSRQEKKYEEEIIKDGTRLIQI